MEVGQELASTGAQLPLCAYLSKTGIDRKEAPIQLHDRVRGPGSVGIGREQRTVTGATKKRERKSRDAFFSSIDQTSPASGIKLALDDTGVEAGDQCNSRRVGEALQAQRMQNQELCNRAARHRREPTGRRPAAPD